MRTLQNRLECIAFTVSMPQRPLCILHALIYCMFVTRSRKFKLSFICSRGVSMFQLTPCFSRLTPLMTGHLQAKISICRYMFGCSGALLPVDAASIDRFWRRCRRNLRYHCCRTGIHDMKTASSGKEYHIRFECIASMVWLAGIPLTAVGVAAVTARMR